MEIFKLFESTIANCEPGHPSNKGLRRSQLLDNYEEAIETLKLLIRTKENEVAYRRDLVDMLDKSKLFYDNKLTQARQSYVNAKKQAPESLDIKSLSSSNTASNVNKKTSSDSISTTPPNPPQQQQSMNSSSLGAPVGVTMAGTTITPQTGTPSTTHTNTSIISTPNNFNSAISATGGGGGRGPLLSSSSQQSSSSQKSFNDSLDIPLPSTESQESRSSLDRRLSEFLKTFPNLTQAGLAPPVSNNNSVKPLPGYYTQQPQAPPPPMVAATPPIMAMMRFPPPTLIPPPPQTGQLNVPPPQTHNLNTASQQENHDAADMDLSDYDDSNNNGSSSGPSSQAGGIIPMVASAMQQGAGGKQHLRGNVDTQQSPYATGYNNPAPYAPRLNPLPFDPSIMDSRLRDSSSSSSGSRDKHNDRSHRHSGSGMGKHGSDKSKYTNSSSHSSGRSKKR